MHDQTLTDKLRILRRDDHRYYHQSRINQTLHLFSAIGFLAAYVLLFIDPARAALVGWLIGMVTRQSGHIFFEPRGYDRVNGASDEHKEAIKVGFNMRRKAVLLTLWSGIPLLLWWLPGPGDYLHRLGLAWLALGAAGLCFRALQLCLLRNPVWALAWVLKILTDPFHNVAIYRRSPLALLRGQWLDPMPELELPAAVQGQA